MPQSLATTLLIAAVFTAGCKSFNAMQGFPERGANVRTEIKTLSALVAKTESDFSAIDKAKDAEARNSYIYNRLALADLEYDQMVKTTGGIKNGIDAGEQIAVGAMGAAGAIVGGGAAQALSAGVAATTAGAVAIDKTYFYNQAMPTMITAMNAGRQAVYADIAVGLTKDYADYPIATAWKDLNRYYFAGSLAGAQNSINQDSGKKAETASANTANATVISNAQKKQKTGTLLDAVEEKALQQYNAR